METIYHAFGEKIYDIDLEALLKQGFTGVQTNVLQRLKPGLGWFLSYQPDDFTVGNNFGTSDDLIKLCTKAKSLNMKIIVDVVLRHTSNLNGEDGKNVPNTTVASRLVDNPYFWTGSPNVIEYTRYNTIHGSCCLPMLNYDNWDLQDIYIEFLQELKDCGVSGFRIDMGKHFALADEGSNFWERVFGGFSDMFNYAECLTDCDRLDDYAKIMKVLTDGHTTNPADMVSFVMSHDTELNKPYVTSCIDDEEYVRRWGELDKKSSVLFYPRPKSDLWKSDKIREINFSRQAS